MRQLLPLLLALWLALIAFGAGATALSSYSFESKEEEEAFRELTAQLRCLVCQNQSLADSDAELAQDLRREVYGMWKQGKPENEITDFLVQRYGDFVLYDPPLKPSTYLLWFGPFIFLVIGAVLLFRTLMRKSRDREVVLTEQDQQRLNELLGTSSDKRDSKK